MQKIQFRSSFKSSVGIAVVDVDLNWLNWFHFLILEECRLLIIMTDSMIFLPPFLDVTSMSISRVPFLAQLDHGILSM